MDRQIVYPGAIPLETDLLNTNKNAMIGLSKLAAAILGTSTFLNGLACTPTGPASLQVYVAPGEIYSLQNIDGTAYSSIAADTTHAILKQGISLDQLTLSCPAPVTAGQSVNYLIQVAYQDTDSGAVVLPYYNSSNPSQAYAGPANSGTAQNTVRKGVCAVSAKAGVAATTGTQTTPAPDAGYIGAFVVTVAYGQTQITAPNISTYAGAPFIPAGGLIVGGLQGNACNISAAGGTADAITGSYTPGITALTNGMTLYVRAGSANATTTPTFTPASGAIAAKQIVKGAGSALVAGDIAGGGHWIELQYDPTLDKWVLQNPTHGFGGTPAQFDNTLKTATTAFVQRALGNYQGALSYSAGGAQALTAADAGKQVILSGVTSGTLALPSLASIGEGAAFLIKAESSAGWSVTCPDGAAIVSNGGGAVSSVAVGGDQFLIIVKNATLWRTYGTVIGFSANLTGNGYQRLPNGMILQWGENSAGSTAGAQSVSFNIAFPVAGMQVVATFNDTTATTPYAVAAKITDRTAFTMRTSSASAVFARWIALGY